MKIGQTQVNKAYIGTNEVQKIYKGTTQIYPAGGGYYNVGTPSFVMRFDGSFEYYAASGITAQKVATPTLTTGGKWNKGCLDKTYDSNDPTALNAVQINIDKSAWQTNNSAFFIEFWAKLDNTTDLTQPQDFLGNMEMDGNNFNGWRFVWSSLRQAIDLEYQVDQELYIRDYDSLESVQKTAWQAAPVAGSWCHYGMYIKPTSTGYLFANGVRRGFRNSSTASSISNSSYGCNNILIANGKAGTKAHYYNGGSNMKTGCATLSPMGEVRILTGQNAEDYLAAIEGTRDSTTAFYSYTVPTGSFATSGLTKYTAS